MSTKTSGWPNPPRPGRPARRGRDAALIMTARGCFPAHPADPRIRRLRRSEASWPDETPLSFRFVVSFLLRLAARALCGLLSHEPPRSTRPTGGPSGSRDGSNHPPRRRACKCHVAAWPAWAILDDTRAALISGSPRYPPASGRAGRAAGCGNGTGSSVRRRRPPASSTSPRKLAGAAATRRRQRATASRKRRRSPPPRLPLV